MILHDTCCPAALLLLPHACPPPHLCSSPITVPAPAPTPTALALCSALCLPPHSCSPHCSQLSMAPCPAPAPVPAPAPAPLQGSAPCCSMHTPAPPLHLPLPLPLPTDAWSCLPRSFVPTNSSLHPSAPMEGVSDGGVDADEVKVDRVVGDAPDSSLAD
ncbi:hypothetical protein DFH08DRAFT_1034254 [Mycena albidolilacea]|uniref:Uncharacterized protein n=1 Tax=Mycena albidolilacea TaxID=1033008 RepID=A0AAD6ZGF3_9AGAR|nr:hypothetical protein DFH08DRAFT_1034254 [Mycena albidolilacea]